MKKTITILLTLCLSAFSFGQNVNIPDANFKAYLVGNPAINTDNDDEISIAEAEAFTDTIDVSGDWITKPIIQSLTGIEAFVNITGLNCYQQRINTLPLHNLTKLIYLNCSANTSLSSLNVTHNPNLTYLNCDSLNNGSSFVLDVTQNLNLTYLKCGVNSLTNLDISNNNFLKYLNCRHNGLSSLDITQNTSLANLQCSSNQLTNLDVSGLNNLTSLNCRYNDLTTICVSPSHNTSNWQKDVSAEWSTNCKPLSFFENQNSEKAKVLKAYNLHGQEVPLNTKGEVIILLYDNGVREKTYVAE